MSSIFDRIFKYRESEKRSPREDYFTEVFASILDKHDALKTAFVEHLIGHDRGGAVEIHKAEVETQKSFRGGARRVDLYMEAFDRRKKRHLLIIENKIDSGEGEGQLDAYAKLLERAKDASTRTLVYITKRTSNSHFEIKTRRVRFRHIKWFDMYNWVKLWAETSDNGESAPTEFLNEFMTFMEDWNMGGEINAASLRAAVRYHDSLDAGWRLVAEMIDPAWDESTLEDVMGETNGNWVPRYWNCCQSSPKMNRFGNARISMGFRFDRRDANWNVDETELPSGAVTVTDSETGKFPCPSGDWQKGPVEGMGQNDLWVKQTNEKPCHGESLSGFYRRFFLTAFVELSEVMKTK